MDERELAERLVRLHSQCAGLGTAARSLARFLLGLGERVPAGTTLVIGGSLSRGEPCIRVTGDGWRLRSDLDLLLVHEDPVPPRMPAGFTSYLGEQPVSAEVMTLSARQFAGIATSLGFDFKENGLVLSRGAAPAYQPTTITARDAREILAYTIFVYFWNGLGRRWADGECGAALDNDYGRVTLKALRTVVMLAGGYSQHFAGKLPCGLEQALRTELESHDAIEEPAPLPPHRFLNVLRLALRAHADRLGADVHDAVTNSEYAGRPGADYISVQQQLAFECARHLVADVPEHGLDRRDITELQRHAWRRAVERFPCIRAAASAEAYFAGSKTAIQQTLLMMKLPTTERL